MGWPKIPAKLNERNCGEWSCTPSLPSLSPPPGYFCFPAIRPGSQQGGHRLQAAWYWWADRLYQTDTNLNPHLPCRTELSMRRQLLIGALLRGLEVGVPLFAPTLSDSH